MNRSKKKKKRTKREEVKKEKAAERRKEKGQQEDFILKMGLMLKPKVDARVGEDHWRSKKL